MSCWPWLRALASRNRCHFMWIPAAIASCALTAFGRRSPRSARGHGEDTHCTLSLEPDDAEFWFRKGVVQRHRGEAAAECATANPFAVQAREIRQRRSGNRRPRHPVRILAKLARVRGDHQEADASWPGNPRRMSGRQGCAPEPERRRRLACRRTSTKLNRHGPTTGRTDCRCGEGRPLTYLPRTRSIWERHLSKYVNPPVQASCISI